MEQFVIGTFVELNVNEFLRLPQLMLPLAAGDSGNSLRRPLNLVYFCKHERAYRFSIRDNHTCRPKRDVFRRTSGNRFCIQISEFPLKNPQLLIIFHSNLSLLLFIALASIGDIGKSTTTKVQK